ncbi:DUF4168 domain-containing protein [Sphingomonas sp. SRS2]|uniref:DUF4168 domain-containing protein n=1 Tax=Sphingomonas sp. SRS2 TaxID=133190 RepID=UPI000A0482AA|nr:DUF4168 domain-containing protein [Sphingomonas sp. SRS2]
MQRLRTRVLATAALLSLAPAAALAAPPATVPDKVSQRDLRNYASALVKVLEIRRIADHAWKAAGPAERASLKAQSQRAIYEALARYSFTEASFNQISAAVERTPALRRRVRDLVMRESLDL